MSSMTTTAEWIDIAAADAVPAGDVIGVETAGLDIALFNVDGTIHATDNRCTHGDGRLCDGFLEGHEIECPLHQGKFDVRSGKATYAPADKPIRSYPVKVKDGRIWLVK
ncbi:non-heme iron oxygenase ferredoxin subunit [Variovorax humicola]|jgi:naphthalene 1,2-dioxygenase system ferredoxin subunit|uniref:Non-heme iron oxygenase ferredoxin subunit n=2 Tax=Variovorax humicola TaxID=1769758 RepID=A0ABU8VX27_9BURK